MKIILRKSHELKFRRYAVCMTEIRKYLDISPESKASYKIREMELNKTPLHSMMNDWSIK